MKHPIGVKLRFFSCIFTRETLGSCVVIFLFALPFLIPVWTISRTSGNYATFEKIRALNEEGIRYWNDQDYSRSIRHFTGALKLDPNNKAIKKNLSNAYIDFAIEQKSHGDADAAIDVLQKASDLNTNNESVHTLLARIYFEKGDLMAAESEARIALLLKPDDPHILKFLARVNYLLEDFSDAMDQYTALSDTYRIPGDTEEVKRVCAEQQISTSYQKMSCHPFIIYYPDEAYRHHARWVAESLVKVYFRLSSWWGFNPQHEIAVYLYPEETFAAITNSSGEVIGLYDGKIRLLVNHDNQMRLQKTATHEYTHFALNALTHMNVPFWCNEGLAQYVAGEWDPVRARMFDISVEQDGMLDYRDMESNLSDFFDLHDRTLAYIQSYIAIRFLIDQYGEESIVELIGYLKQGWSAERAVEQITLLTYPEFRTDIARYYVDSRKDDLIDGSAITLK